MTEPIERAPDDWESSYFAALGRTLERVLELPDGTTRYVVSARDPRAPSWRSATRRKVIPRAPHIVAPTSKNPVAAPSVRAAGGPVQASIFDAPNANEAAAGPPRSIALPPAKEEMRCRIMR